MSVAEQQRNLRGTAHPSWLTLRPLVQRMSQVGTSVLARQQPCCSGEGGQGSTRAGCLPPLAPAAPLAPQRLWAAPPFLLRWFRHLSAPVTDRQSWLLLGSVAGHQKPPWNALSAWLPLGPPGMVHVHPLVLLWLFDQEHGHRGPFHSLLHRDPVTPGQSSC